MSAKPEHLFLDFREFDVTKPIPQDTAFVPNLTTDANVVVDGEDCFDLFELTNLQLGHFLPYWWLGVCRHLRTESDPPISPEWVRERIQELVDIDTKIDDPRGLPMMRAFSLAAKGQYERAGAVWRLIHESGIAGREALRLAALGAKVKDQRGASSKKGSTAWQAMADANRRQWKEVGLDIRTKHPQMSNLRLAQLIACKTGNPGSVHAVRKALARLGLKRKKNGNH